MGCKNTKALLLSVEAFLVSHDLLEEKQLLIDRGIQEAL